MFGRNRGNGMPVVAASAVVFAALSALAAEVGVTGKKLVIVDKLAAANKAKVVYVSKLDPGIDKGAAGDAAQMAATFVVEYGDDSSIAGGFVMPAGAGWLVNKDAVTKYVNKQAPDVGGHVKVAVVKPTKVAKIVTKGLGDGPVLDLIQGGAPSAEHGVITRFTVTNGNDGSTTVMCTQFAADLGSTVVFKEIAGGSGRKLVAKNGQPCPTQTCEVLNGSECLLPYPSSHFLRTDPSTATGQRVSLPAAGLPTVNGPATVPDPWNQLDGFSPTAPAIMHFPQGVDLELSDAARLLAPGCCGQPAGPPWIETRTYTERSLETDSPSVLLDVDTGQRVLHWLELDGRATGGDVPGRQALFLRPAQSLVPGHRYVVAMRDLKTAANDDVVAEAAFEALRDDVPSGDPAVEARRADMEANVFAPLALAGIDRNDLVLAFDFVVQSEDQLTRQMLSMRDQAFAWLATVEADAGAVPFTVDSVVDNDCMVPGTQTWRHVSGTFQSPLFLDGEPVQSGAQFLNVDVHDLPVQNGFMDAPFDVTIPCSIFDVLVTNRPIVLGHGIFGTGQGMVTGIPQSKNDFGAWDYIAGGTDWIGLSSNRDKSTDINWIGQHIIGFGSSQFNNFPAFVDRLRQGVLNTLVLAKMMKLGIFNRDVAFESAPGVGVFPGSGEEMYYYGISLGGIYGTYFSGLTPDVERFGLDVPAIGFGACLLQRSTQFLAFDLVIQAVGVVDPMQTALLISLVDELWVSGEPASVARRITSNPLPGSGGPSKLLYHPAWLDKQVSNQCTEAAARTIGLPNLEGSLVEELAGIPDVAGPVDSAMVMWDTGAFDLFNPAHQADIPALSNVIPTNTCDPHGGPRQTPAAVRQLLAFLQPGGTISNFCNGTCDAAEPLEIPGGGTCDGTSPVLLQGLPCGEDVECGGGACTGATVCDPLAP